MIKFHAGKGSLINSSWSVQRLIKINNSEKSTLTLACDAVVVQLPELTGIKVPHNQVAKCLTHTEKTKALRGKPKLFHGKVFVFIVCWASLLRQRDYYASSCARSIR